MLSTTVLWLLPVSAAVIGLFLLRDILRAVRLARHGRRAAGRIIREELKFIRYSHAHLPVVRFQDEMGTVHEFRSRWARKTSFREQGEEVTVAYDPKSPEASAVILSASHFGPTIVSFALLFGSVVGITVLLLWK